MKYLLMIGMFFYAAFSHADEVTHVTKQEINHLIKQLENSGCQFLRNGTWHSASEASAHLTKKYAYLLRKNLLKSTESFIANAATESSLSGKPYEVKCDNSPTVLSEVWFYQQLHVYRNTHKRD